LSLTCLLYGVILHFRSSIGNFQTAGHIRPAKHLNVALNNLVLKTKI